MVLERHITGKSMVAQGMQVSDASRKRVNAIKILDDVANIKDRILNPASHAGAAPIYTKEAEDAVKVIQALEAALGTALTTL